MLASYDNPEQLVQTAFGKLARRKLGAADRESLRAILANPAPAEGSRDLTVALTCENRAKRLRDLVHMHCNRFGLDRDGEQRVARLLRALALAHLAGQPAGLLSP